MRERGEDVCCGPTNGRGVRKSRGREEERVDAAHGFFVGFTNIFIWRLSLLCSVCLPPFPNLE